MLLVDRGCALRAVSCPSPQGSLVRCACRALSDSGVADVLGVLDAADDAERAGEAEYQVSSLVGGARFLWPPPTLQ
eukprot:7194807-Alexandrium_andersonii.AAC.1